MSDGDKPNARDLTDRLLKSAKEHAEQEAADREAAARDAAQARGQKPAPPPPIPWPLLDVDDRAQALAALTDWMATILVPHYSHDLEPVRPCWASHDAALDALTALQQLWTQAWGATGDPTLRSQWLVMWKRQLLGEVEHATRSCSRGHRHPAAPEALLASVETRSRP